METVPEQETYPKDNVRRRPWLALVGARQGPTELTAPGAALPTPDKSQTLPQGSLEDDRGYYCQGEQETKENASQLLLGG